MFFCYLEHDLREPGERLLFYLKMDALMALKGAAIILSERSHTLLSSDELLGRGLFWGDSSEREERQLEEAQTCLISFILVERRVSSSSSRPTIS